jgi:hypothetical protein
VDNTHGAIFVGQDAAHAEVELNSNYIEGTLWLGAKTTLARLSESDNCLQSGGKHGGESVAAEDGDGGAEACSSSQRGQVSADTVRAHFQRGGGDGCSIPASGVAVELQSGSDIGRRKGHADEDVCGEEGLVGGAAGRSLREEDSCTRDSYASMRASSTGDSMGKDILYLFYLRILFYFIFCMRASSPGHSMGTNRRRMQAAAFA